MVGNLAAVTAAPARTSVPSDHGSAVTMAGKSSSSGGEDLPAAHAAVVARNLDGALHKLTETMAGSRNLSFRVDQGSGRTVITVVDATTGDVIRQIPAEEVLALSRRLQAAGAILDARA